MTVRALVTIEMKSRVDDVQLVHAALVVRGGEGLDQRARDLLAPSYVGASDCPVHEAASSRLRNRCSTTRRGGRDVEGDLLALASSRSTSRSVSLMTDAE
jgi:hypothetical protein